MAFFQHVETRLDGPVAYVSAITDLALLSVGGVLRLYAATAQGGGVSVRSLDPGMALLGSTAHPASAGLAALPRLVALDVAGQSLLAVAGQADAGLRGYLMAGGVPGAQRLYATGATEAYSAMAQIDVGGRSFVITAALGGTTVTSREVGETGAISTVSRVTVGTAQPGLDIGAIAVAEVGSLRLVLAVSAFDNRLISLRLSDTGVLTAGASLGADQGLWVSAPCVLETVQLGGTSYALLGSAGSSSISVVRISGTGALTVTDQVTDSLDTRFQGIGALEVVRAGDRVFVIAGGGDDGLTLLTLLPTGRLLHLATMEDTVQTALTGISALAARWTGSVIEVFAAGRGEAGIGRFRVDVGTLAPMILGGAAADTLTGDVRADLIDGEGEADVLSGGAGADILLDGDGIDTLFGGTGGDTFVMSADGVADQIRDFRLSEDRLDLSAWGMLYDVRQLTVTPTATGATLRFGAELLTLFSDTGGPIAANALTNDHIVNLQHSPVIPVIPAPEEVVPKTGSAGADVMSGGASKDILRGGGGDDRLSGAGGGDELEGGTGLDTLDGGAGNDSLSGDAGADVLDGGDGQDRLFGGTEADVLAGGADDDLLEGGADNDTLRGDAGNDTLSGDSDRDVLEGGIGADHLFGGTGADTLHGGAGNDLLDGGEGADSLTGGVGADLFVIGTNAGADTVADFEIGLDRLDLTAFGPLYSIFELGVTSTATGASLRHGAVSVVLQSADGRSLTVADLAAAGALITLRGYEVPTSDPVPGTPGADDLRGTSDADLLSGLAGNDVLYGFGGDDVLIGGDGADVLDGGAGRDTVSYQGNLRAVLVDLAAPWKNIRVAAGDRFIGIENLHGSDAFDNLRGDDAGNVLWGAGNSDWLYGQGGNDTLIGGDLHDLLTGGAGADLLIGGEGRDRVAYTFGRTTMVIDLVDPSRNTGEAAGDIYDGIEGIAGGRLADQIFGNEGDNFLFGDGGDDRIFGRAGRDYLFGGAGNDWLDGGTSNDRMLGEAGADTFVFNFGLDIIEDFNRAEGDRIGIDRSMTGGVALTGAQLARLASVVGNDVVFNLDGLHSLTLQGVTSLNGLSDALFSV